ncbi:MAG: copper resistance protein CopC [Actinomycetota bacterium]|nr:copper resistance protein CopC [Actinomycetota bacterium]MDA2971850.1 copper resistance protein CopC [Actinomycetota bacterium]MDA3001232.1 copper resistance protein CopC [Actinomycetota bacterium]
MSPHMMNRQFVLRLVMLATILLTTVVAMLSAIASPASADTSLVSSTPADGAELTTAPTQINVVFDQAVPANSVVQAVCNQQPAPLGQLEVGADGISLTVPIVGPLPIGTCNVTYSVPQPDGKVATGGFSFEILDPTSGMIGDDGSDPTDGGNLATDPPPVSGPLGLARLVSYIALAALFGGAMFIALVWPEGVDDMHAPRYLRFTWILAMISTYFVAVLTTSLTTGESVTSALIPTAWMEIVDSASGAAVVLRFVLVAVAFSVIMRPERLIDPATQLLSLAPAGLAVASLAFTRADPEFSIVGTTAGLFHNVSVALWFGGLAILVQAVLVAPGDEDLVHAMRGFTRLAPAFITVAVVSGMIHLYQLDGGAILSSRHGRLIVLKSIGVAGMVYFGMLTRQVVATRLRRAKGLNARLTSSLRRAVATEAVIGVFVLTVSAWAVATLPDRVEPPGTDRTSYAFVGERSGGAFDVQVKVTPASVGLNAVRIDVYSPNTGLTDLVVQFNPPTSDGASVTLNVPLDGAGAARLPVSEGVPFGVPGLWTVIVTGNGPAGPLPSVTYTVSVTSRDGATMVPAVNTTLGPSDTAVTVPMTALVPIGETVAPSASSASPTSTP